MPTPTPEKLAELNQNYQTIVYGDSHTGESRLTLIDGRAEIKIEPTVFKQFLDYFTPKRAEDVSAHPAIDPTILERVGFQVVEGRLITHLNQQFDLKAQAYFDDCLRVFSGVVPEENLRRALLYVAETAGLIKHPWFMDLKPVNMWAYLTYPVLSELGSMLICRNLFSDTLAFGSSARQFMEMPPYTFKGLVEHYFGTKSARLLKALGKIVICGADVERIKIDIPKTDNYGALGSILGEKFMVLRGQTKVFEQLEDGSYVVEGRPKFRNDFLLAGAWIKRMLPLDLVQEFFEYIGSELYMMEKRTSEYKVIPAMPYIQMEVTDFMNQLPARRRLEILKAIMRGDDGSHLINDLAAMMNRYKDVSSIPEALRAVYPDGMKMPKGWKTIKEAHDIVSQWDNEIREEKKKTPIEYGPHELKMDGRIVKVPGGEIALADVKGTLFAGGEPIAPVEGDIVITHPQTFMVKLPHNTIELVRWGKEVKNCIASCSESAVEKRCTLAALYEVKEGKEPEIYGTLEVRWQEIPVGSSARFADGVGNDVNHHLGFASKDQAPRLTIESVQFCTPKLWQCVGMCNQKVSPALFQAVEKAFKEAHDEALQEWLHGLGPDHPARAYKQLHNDQDR